MNQLAAIRKKAEAEAAQRAEREQLLNQGVSSAGEERLFQLEAGFEKAKADVASQIEREQELGSLKATAAQLQQLQADLEKAQHQIAQHAVRETELQAEIESLRRAEALRLNSGFAEVADDTFELVDTKSITLSDVKPDSGDTWLKIDLHHSATPAPTTAGLGKAEQTSPAIIHPRVTGLPENVAERLRSSDSSQRAAALVDLAESGNEQAFEFISNSFDDQSVEVRNAAARALYSWQADLAASFTRALREAPLERRRRIGAAIAGSGLAANAINSLAGEGRDRTYNAFSILFLMAKAGETQPLMTAIAKHPNLEVRLTAVKLIGLSNQQSVLPALRHMASREQLPEEVSGAIMEAIYLLSNQKHEVA